MDIHSLTITMDWQNGVIVDETLDNSVAEIDHKDNVDEIQVNFESQTNVDEICCLSCSKVLKNKESLRKHQQVNQKRFHPTGHHHPAERKNYNC